MNDYFGLAACQARLLAEERKMGMDLNDIVKQHAEANDPFEDDAECCEVCGPEAGHHPGDLRVTWDDRTLCVWCCEEQGACAVMPL